MYLFGYLSLFQNDEKMVEETLTALRVNDEYFRTIYRALKDMDFDKVIEMYQAITDKATLHLSERNVPAASIRRRFSPMKRSTRLLWTITGITRSVWTGRCGSQGSCSQKKKKQPCFPPRRRLHSFICDGPVITISYRFFREIARGGLLFLRLSEMASALPANLFFL